MTSALRQRAELLITADREARAVTASAAPRVSAEVWPISSGTRGSSLFNLLTAGGATSESIALSVSTVYSCVSLIGGAIGGLPFKIYRRTEKGRDRVDSDLWWLFNEAPTDNWTAASAWDLVAQSNLLRGDAYWRILRRNALSPQIVGFEPLLPDWVKGKRDRDGRLLYTITYPDRPRETIEQSDMLHFPGVGFNGVRSLTPLQYALRHGVGIAAAADEFSAEFFRSGAATDTVMHTPGKVSEEQRQALKDRWFEQQGGLKARTPLVLSGEWKVERLSLSAQDAQLLASRQFQVEELCRIFGVPPHMAMKTDAQTSWGSGIEAMSIGFVRYTLRRHLTRIEQEINRKVWPRSLRIYGEFETDALMSGDSTAQSAYFAKALGGPGAQGWMTVNEVRTLKNLPPIEGGDKLVFAGAEASGTGTGGERSQPPQPPRRPEQPGEDDAPDA